MRLQLLTITAMISLAGCSFDPPGLCTASSQCPLGTYCGQGGICVAGCDGDDRCSPWQECSIANHACGLRVGMCAVNTDCSLSQTCAVSSHRCTTNGAACTSSTECAVSEACNFEGKCELASRECTSQAECADYETCQGGGCLLQSGRCRTHEECGSTLTAYCDASHTCSNAGMDVVIHGTLMEGAAYLDAIAPVQVPSRATVGFPMSVHNMALASDGTLVYLLDSYGTGYHLRRFVPDRMKWEDDRWKYPEMPADNDPVIPRQGCSQNYIASFVIQQETGAVAYECDGRTLTVDGGVLNAGGTVLAWNKNGLRLGDCVLGYGYPLCVIGTDGSSTPLKDSSYSWRVGDARAYGDGFRLVASQSGSSADWALYQVGATGEHTRVGSYPAFTGWGGMVLANDGSIVWEAYDGSSYDAIKRLPLDGTLIETIYTEANAPAGANNFTERDFRPYVLLHISYLRRPP